MVYSWGRDLNKSGVLGIGKGVNEVLNPTPIRNLIDYRINSINIDETKAWVISNDGKLFLWGLFNTSQSINNKKLINNENLISNDIIIPQPILVDILLPYFIRKATPFSYIKDEMLRDVGTNICFKYYDKTQMFGLIFGYNPRLNSGKQEAFLSSVSFLDQPRSPIDGFGRGFHNKNIAKGAMSVISEQPIKFYPYEKKLLLKGISDYFLMEDGMIALLTLPHSNDTDEDAYPRLLILLIQNNLSTSDSNSGKISNEYFIYEIPSSLHIIDLK